MASHIWNATFSISHCRRCTWYFWNPKTKLDKLLKEKFEFEKVDIISPSIDLSQSKFKKKNVTIEFSVPNDPYNMCRKTLMQHFYLVTLFDRPWPWPLLSIEPILLCCLLRPTGGLLAEFGFAAIISPVSVADKAKSDNFDRWPDLGLPCNVFKIFFTFS